MVRAGGRGVHPPSASPAVSFDLLYYIHSLSLYILSVDREVLQLCEVFDRVPSVVGRGIPVLVEKGVGVFLLNI
jgi:hypothetical protein